MEVWETTPIFRPKAAKEYYPQRPEGKKYWLSIPDKSTLLDKLRTMDSRTWIISLIHYDKHSRFIYKALNKYDLRYVALLPKDCPNPKIDAPKNRPLSERIVRFFRKIGSYNKICSTIALSRKIPAELVGMRSADYAVVNSDTWRKSVLPVGPRTVIIKGPSHDYTKIVEWKRKGAPLPWKKNTSAPLAVFVDSVALAHPDRIGKDTYCRHVTPEGLYGPIRNALRDLQGKGYQVVVAAHPRAVEKDWLEHYHDFKVIKGQTLELISQSSIVLNFWSSCVAYAVAFNKPVVCLTTDEFEKGEEKLFPYFFAELLGKSVVNLTKAKQLDIKKELKVDHERYAAFTREYLIPSTCPTDKTIWEVVVHELKEQSQA
ncbi:hypothetical protein JCM12178A_08080 [Salidesulfovibrio brasiliensis]